MRRALGLLFEFGGEGFGHGGVLPRGQNLVPIDTEVNSFPTNFRDAYPEPFSRRFCFAMIAIEMIDWKLRTLIEVFPMFAESPQPEPTRPTDAARLDMSKMRLEDGMALETVFQRMTESVANVLEVERVGVWLLIDERKALRCVDLFERSKGTHSSGVTLQTCEFPEYFTALNNRRTIPAEVAMTDHRTNQLADVYLTPLGITSMLDAPIYVGGEVIGVFCNEHTGAAREWTTEQRDFASSMADLLAVKIRAAEMRELKSVLRIQSIQLAETRRIKDLAETAAGLAHDFSNILTVMLGCAELISANPRCTSEFANYAREIAAAGQRGVALAATFMEYAKPGPSSSRVLRPGKVIAGQLTLLQAAAGERHKISLNVNSSTGRVLIDPNQLERVLLNLVVNARDAMPDGGPITVTVDAVSELDEDGKQGQFVLIAVCDRGTGIASEVLTRIFDPYFTTKPRGQGTGVGLAVVQQILAYAGGFARVETAPGDGSTFRVYLPQVSNS